MDNRPHGQIRGKLAAKYVMDRPHGQIRDGPGFDSLRYMNAKRGPSGPLCVHGADEGNYAYASHPPSFASPFGRLGHSPAPVSAGHFRDGAALSGSIPFFI